MRRMVLFGVLAAVLGALTTSPVLAGNKPTAIQPAGIVHKVDGSIDAGKSKFWIPWAGNSGQGAWLTFTPPTSWAGVGVYNSTANHQVAHGWTLGYDDPYGAGPEKITFKISIKNTGNVSDRFTVKAGGAGLAGWTLSFFRGTTNITSGVLAGTYKTPLIAKGGDFAITAKLTGDATVLTPNGLRLVTFKSVADASKVDAVALGLTWYPYCIC